MPHSEAADAGAGPRWAEAAARLLAERHAEPAPPEPGRSVVAAAEVAHDGDWSLRSALVRLAQPEPVRAGAVLEVVRRCDGALAPFVRNLERRTVWSQPSLSPRHLVEDAGRWLLVDDGDRRADTRLADLARLAGGDNDRLAALAGSYHRIAPLSDPELDALDLVAVAVGVEHLARMLTAWARDPRRHPPPLPQIDTATADLTRRLDDLGVPRETRPEPDEPGGRPRARRPRRPPA